MISTPSSIGSPAAGGACEARAVRWLLPAVCCLLLLQAGCTAVSSTAALRDAVVDSLDGALAVADGVATQTKKTPRSAQKVAVEEAADRAALAKADTDDEPREDGDGGSTGDVADENDADEAVVTDLDEGRESDRPAENPEVRQRMLIAAVDGAIERLAGVGGLDDAARATLLATLEETPSDDWPAVIEAFASSLESSLPPRQAPVTPAAAVVSAPAEPPAPAGLEPPALNEPPAPAPSAVAGQPATGEAAAAAVAPTPTSLAVNNACFASRVLGWGSVERFAADRFQPGQEVIVYFELANLASNETEAGHTTSIDTVLRLVDADGRRLHEWTFHPIDETCRNRRRDYFVRYLVQFPADLPAGACRLELAVTDAVAATTAQASLPLEIAAVEQTAATK